MHCKSHDFLLVLLLQATRGLPGGVTGVLSTHNCNSVGMGNGKTNRLCSIDALLCGSSLVFVSSLVEATDREEGGKKTNSYRGPMEKDWFLSTNLDKRPIYPVAATLALSSFSRSASEGGCLAVVAFKTHCTTNFAQRPFDAAGMLKYKGSTLFKCNIST